MADTLEIATRITGDGMPIGHQLTPGILPTQVEIKPGEVNAPKFDDNAAVTITWMDYQDAIQYLDENSWLAEWQYVDYAYQSPNYDRDWRANNRPARISRFLVAKNRNTMSTQVRRGIFGDSNPFLLEPRGKLAAAKDKDGEEQTERLLSAWTELFNVLNKRANFDYNFSLLIESQVLQGTGNAIPEWETRKRKIKTRRRKTPPVNIDMPVGPAKKVDTWKSDDFAVKDEVIEESLPTFEYRRLGTTVWARTWRTPGRPDLTGGYRIDIDYVNLQDLRKMRAQPCYKNIPDDEELKKFFLYNPNGDAETGSQLVQSMTNQSTTVLHAAGPNENVSQDPFKKPLLKIRRWDEDTVTEVLVYDGRKLCIRNEEHGIGDQAMGYSATWWNIENSGYGMGQGRLNVGDQRIEQGTLNEALKMIAFPLNAPVLYDRSSGNAPTQNTLVGLGTWLGVDTGRAGDVRKAVGFMEMPQVPPEAWQMLQYAHKSGENVSGADSISMQGNVNSPGSSAMRTATGVQRAGSKADDTVADPIAHLEWVIERWLNFLWDRVLEDMPIAEIRRILSDKFGEAILEQIDTEEFLGAEFNIKILAGQKLQAKAAILQLIPFLIQILSQPQLMEWLHQKGWTVNFKSIEDIFQRMSELQSWQDIFVRLTHEEMQSVQSMNQGAQRAQADVAKEKLRGQNELAKVQEQGKNAVQETILEKAIDRLGPEQLLRTEATLERQADTTMLTGGGLS
jgi:hypothetical protein